MKTENEEIYEEPQFQIKGVLSGVLRVFRENYKPLILISFVGLLLNFVQGYFWLLIQLLTRISTLHPVGFRIVVIILFPMFWYFSIRVNMVLKLVIARRFLNYPLELKKQISKSKEKFWRYLGANIVFFLVLFILIAATVGIGSIIYHWIGMVLSLLVFGIPILITVAKLIFMDIIVLLEDDSTDYFSQSNELAKGNLLQLTLLLFIWSIPHLFLPYLINVSHRGDLFLLNIILKLGLYLLITPFFSVVLVVSYYKLKDVKNFKTEEVITE